jgi:hypothetical protein
MPTAGLRGTDAAFSGNGDPGNAAKNSFASFASIAGSGTESGIAEIKPETP